MEILNTSKIGVRNGKSTAGGKKKKKGADCSENVKFTRNNDISSTNQNGGSHKGSSTAAIPSVTTDWAPGHWLSKRRSYRGPPP